MRKRKTSRYKKLKKHYTIRTKKMNIPRHNIIKTLNIQNKERILKAAKQKRQVPNKVTPIKVAANFSAQTLNARRSWKDIMPALNEDNCQHRPICPAKLFFLFEGEIKSFHNEDKLKEFVITKPALKKILKGLLYMEEETRVK
jgi:hypothetical protein